MNDWSLPWVGGCRCGALRFAISAPPLLSSACHCSGCQRMTGSAFSLSLAIPADGFAITAGESVLGGLRGASAHHCCAQCLSWVFTRPEGLDWLVNVRATMLDDARWVVPFIEFWVSEGLPWARTSAVHSFVTEPAMDAFPALLAAFAEQGVRPPRRSAVE